VGPSAHLRLRGGTRPLRAHVVWPAGAAAAAGIMILLVDADEAGATAQGESLCRAVAETLGLLALVVACRGHEDGAAAVEWTVDHAAELRADGSRMVLAGLHAGAAAAAASALHARDTGWPAVARQILVHPRLDALAPAPLEGVAPAIVVGDGGRAYAARLRAAGVPVEELEDPDGLLRHLAGIRC
jgi:acetyl esterase